MGLDAEQEPRRDNGITADIHERAAAPFGDVANVVGVAVGVAENAHHRAQFADAALTHNLPRAHPLRSHQSFWL